MLYTVYEKTVYIGLAFVCFPFFGVVGFRTHLKGEELVVSTWRLPAVAEQIEESPRTQPPLIQSQILECQFVLIIAVLGFFFLTKNPEVGINNVLKGTDRTSWGLPEVGINNAYSSLVMHNALRRKKHFDLFCTRTRRERERAHAWAERERERPTHTNPKHTKKRGSLGPTPKY